jgi:hypothetical protein
MCYLRGVRLSLKAMGVGLFPQRLQLVGWHASWLLVKPGGVVNQGSLFILVHPET